MADKRRAHRNRTGDPVTFYRANRDLSFVAAGDTFTEKDVPPGVSLEALTLGGAAAVASVVVELEVSADTVEEIIAAASRKAE